MPLVLVLLPLYSPVTAGGWVASDPVVVAAPVAATWDRPLHEALSQPNPSPAPILMLDPSLWHAVAPNRDSRRIDDV